MTAIDRRALPPAPAKHTEVAPASGAAVAEDEGEGAGRQQRQPAPTSSPAPEDQVERAIEQIVCEVAELPDRTSPEDAPDVMLVTAEELAGIVRAALAALPSGGEDVIERCAAVADELSDCNAQHIAERIRALKSTPR